MLYIHRVNQVNGKHADNIAAWLHEVNKTSHIQGYFHLTIMNIRLVLFPAGFFFPFFQLFLLLLGSGQRQQVEHSVISYKTQHPHRN